MVEKFKSGALWFFKSFIWLGILMFVIDIVSKSIVVNNMVPHQSIVLIPGFLSITYIVNTNAAFGIGITGEGGALANRIIYIVVATIACAVIVFLYVKKFKKLNMFYRATMMLILVGAFGNLVDRVFYTPEYLHNDLVGVVDWIDFNGIWKYVFNWADSCIVVGTLMLAIYLIVDEFITASRQRKIELKKELDAKNGIAPALEEKPLDNKEESAKETEEKVEK